MSGFLVCPYLVSAGTAQVVAPSFVAAGAANANITSGTLALPAGLQADDIMLMIIETPNETVSSTGWAHVTGSPAGHGTAGGASSVGLNILWKRHSGSEIDPATVTYGGAAHWCGAIIGIRGCINTGNPWSAAAFDGTGGTGTTATMPTITPTTDLNLVVLAASNGNAVNSTTEFSAFTNGNLTSITERVDQMIALGGGGGVGVATGLKATAGAVGTSTVTMANSDQWAAATVGLTPT